MYEWCPQQESNLQLALRRGSLYPFNYGDVKPGYYTHFCSENKHLTVRLLKVSAISVSADVLFPHSLAPFGVCRGMNDSCRCGFAHG